MAIWLRRLQSPPECSGLKHHLFNKIYRWRLLMFVWCNRNYFPLFAVMWKLSKFISTIAIPYPTNIIGFKTTIRNPEASHEENSFILLYTTKHVIKGCELTEGPSTHDFIIIISLPEPKAHRWAYSIGRHPSSVRRRRPSVVTIFKRHLLWSHEANYCHISHIASIDRGNEKYCFLPQSDENSGCYGNI